MDALPCFAEDAQIVARGQQLNGREEIGRFLAERQADSSRNTAHLIVNQDSITSMPTSLNWTPEASYGFTSLPTATRSTSLSKPRRPSG